MAKVPINIVVIDGRPFDTSIKHLSLDSHVDIEELKKLAEFESLASATFAGTNLDDMGLHHVCEAVTIKTLNLQWTDISDQGLSSLAKLPRLESLRLKENNQLTNECIAHLTKLDNLTDLQIHGTSIDQQGLKQLVCMKNLRDLCIDSDNCGNSFEMVIALSLQMPDCIICVKGYGEFHDGEFCREWH